MLPGDAPAPPRPRTLADLVASTAIAGAVALAAALWQTRSLVIPSVGGPWYGMADAPTAPRIVLSALLGIVVALIVHRRPRRERTALLWLLLAAAPLVPAWSGRGLPLLAFQGPLLALIAAAVVAAIALPWVISHLPLSRLPPWAAFAMAFAFYALVATRLPGPSGAQGDEPHYLVMTQSLLSDGDLDLTDEFANREYAGFFPAALAPHASPNTPKDRLLSVHSPGLSALLLPAYAAGGERGARLFMAFLAALSSALVLRLVRDVFCGRLALAVWLLFTLTPPLPFYAVSLYPEAVAVLAVAVFLVSARGTPRPGWIALAAACAALLPWLHSKMVPLAAVGLLLVLLRPVSRRARLFAGGAFAASILALLAFFQSSYGTASLSAAFGTPDLSFARLPRGAAALLLDRQFGLVTTGPAWALALPGLAWLLRRRTGDGLRALLLIAVPLVVGACFTVWWGGSCPPARFLLPALPAFALCAGAALRARPTLSAALGGAGFALVALSLGAPHVLHNRADGDSALLHLLSPAVDLNAFLPSFFDPGLWPTVVAVSLLAALALAFQGAGRGLALGLLGYALTVHALSTRPLVDVGTATLEVLQDWEPDRFSGPMGPPRVRNLRVPIELPRSPWHMETGQLRNSRRTSLPPGDYRIEIVTRPLGPGPYAVSLSVHAGELVLATSQADSAEQAKTFSLLLPAGARAIGLAARATAGEAEIVSATFVPEAVPALSTRAGLTWPEFAWADRYRLPAGLGHVTVLGRAEPEPAGFRIAGTEEAFLLDGPPAAVTTMTLVSGGPAVVRWEGGQQRLDAPGTVHVPMSAGVNLGAAAALPLRVSGVGVLRFSVDPPP